MRKGTQDTRAALWSPRKSEGAVGWKETHVSGYLLYMLSRAGGTFISLLLFTSYREDSLRSSDLLKVT